MNILKLAGILVICLSVTGCATNPATGNFEITRTGVGLTVGAVGGALVGAALGDSSMAIKGAALGAAAGGGAGYLWEKRYRAMQAELAYTDLQVQQASVSSGQQSLVVTVPADVFFRVGSSDIAPDAYPALSKLAESLKAQQYKVGITGHTDDTGLPDMNNRLSYDRARSVAAYLTAAGVPYDRLFVRGAGANEPKFSNANPQGRSQNRRVEIALSEVAPGA